MLKVNFTLHSATLDVDSKNKAFKDTLAKLNSSGFKSKAIAINMFFKLAGAGSRAQLEEMLRQGYSMQEVMDHFMKHGKTEEEEQKALTDRLQVGEHQNTEHQKKCQLKIFCY